MGDKKYLITGLILFLSIFATLSGCIAEKPVISGTETVICKANPTGATAIADILDGYAFPTTFDAEERYIFYLHGKTIEDQGIPAYSDEYGEYEYLSILEKLVSYDFVVISEQRAKDTNSTKYAERVVNQIKKMIHNGVPADHITVIGASKGAGIAILTSNLLENSNVNFVLMGICNEDTVDSLLEQEISLYGNILSIYDSVDEYGGSCEKLFTYSEGKGISKHDEIVLHIGTGHGILFHPLDEWITPVVEWTGNPK